MQATNLARMGLGCKSSLASHLQPLMGKRNHLLLASVDSKDVLGLPNSVLAFAAMISYTKAERSKCLAQSFKYLAAEPEVGSSIPHCASLTGSGPNDP